MHPDGPAYLSLAHLVWAGRWDAVLGGYYSPLYPMLVAPLVAAGVDPPLAGRLVATVAGVAAIPLVYAFVRRTRGADAAAIAAVAVAVLPALVKSSADVLPETTAGLLLLATFELLARATSPAAAAGAALLAGATFLARPEGVLAVALGTIAAARRRIAWAPLFLVVATAAMAPALLALHARTGAWHLSDREGALAAMAGAAGETSLAGTALHHPGAFAARFARGIPLQLWNTLAALGPVLAIPFAVGLCTTRARPQGPLALVAAFTAGPLALDPSPRYAVPLLPFLLPTVAAGALVLRDRLADRARPVAAAALVALVVLALWNRKGFDEACMREVRDLVLRRYGPGVRLVAVDGRFAYLAHARSLVPPTTAPDAALALARTGNARLWLTRPQWLGRDFAPPPDARAVDRPCGGTFVLYEIGAP
jgi:4-amino-4-deoxy-L-arabinose transferase-like glycosyltransferase